MCFLMVTAQSASSANALPAFKKSRRTWAQQNASRMI
jgi:hypothetical protein